MGFEKSYVPLHGGMGVKNCHNHPYVINEWPLIYETDLENILRKIRTFQLLDTEDTVQLIEFTV